VSSF
jgi:hypothetical protein